MSSSVTVEKAFRNRCLPLHRVAYDRLLPAEHRLPCRALVIRALQQYTHTSFILQKGLDRSCLSDISPKTRE